SSRRRHTRFSRDWSSDVCSSDLDEFEVRIVPKSAYPGPGETRAVATLSKIIKRHGIEHARLVMATLAETGNNKAALEAAAFGAEIGRASCREKCSTRGANAQEEG